MKQSCETTSGHTGALGCFLVVGAIGFIVDACVLTALLRVTTMAPWLARIVSFVPAVLVTWSLNRVLTFRGRKRRRAPLEALAYIAIQSLGAAINLGAFVLCLTWLPALHATPIVPLAIGSGLALLCNYTAANFFLYSQALPGSAAAPPRL